jgi:hypothetical protein
MSVLETPRIYFKGEIAWDPITTNNYDNNYDEGTGEAILPASLNRVQAFRTQAIDQVANGAGNWNPHGTHRSVFNDSAVCGFDIGGGLAANDPFVSGAVSFSGMLVDLEAYGAYSSQLFFDAMRFGVDGGYRILAPRSSRFTDRYLNFARYTGADKMTAGPFSVVWQTSFAKADGLTVDAFDSAALQALATALQDDDVLGLTVRFNSYRTTYYDDAALTKTSPATQAKADALTAKLRAGGFQPNPARSHMVGVLGLWRKSDPPHEPGDRALLPAGNSPMSGAPTRFGKASVALDLSNSVAEIDTKLTKQDLGTLSLVAVDGAGTVTSLAAVPYSAYDRAAYEASAGIVVAPVAASAVAAAAGQDLQLRDAKGNVLLAETAQRALPLAPNLYLTEGETANARFQVYDRGQPATGVLDVTLYTMSADGGSIASAQAMTTGADGVLTVPLTGAAGAITAYVPTLAGGDPAPSQGINPQANTYMYVRALPSDDAVAALPPTFENVYTRVLANWNAMAPCMDNWLNLDDAAQVKAYGRMLKYLTDPANFELFRFMPVTRDMTPGERTLLYKFLDAPPEHAPEALKAEPELHGFAALSRAQRRP